MESLIWLRRLNLRKDTTQSDILDEVNVKEITSQLMEILSIRYKPKQSVDVSDTHVKEIKEYLLALDLIYENQVNTIDGDALSHTIFIQPGMRYCQAQALVYSLMNDKTFASISEYDKKNVTGRILDEVRGRMMEDIVLRRDLSRGLFAYKHAMREVMHFRIVNSI